MIDVSETWTSDALEEWGQDFAQYEHLQESLAVARRAGPLEGSRFELAARSPRERPLEQRSAIARAVAVHLEAKHNGRPLRLTLALFDTYWRPGTAVSRRRGAQQLVERLSRRFGIEGSVLDEKRVEGPEGIRWSVTLGLLPADLPTATAVVEQQNGALLVPAARPDAESVLRDLFADEHGELGTRPLWPLWAVRRAERGDTVIVAHEFNDHTGRCATVTSRAS